MQSLSLAPPDFISSPHCALMSVLQALTTAEAAKAEWVISRAAVSAAMQVKVLISDVLLGKNTNDINRFLSRV
jgi:hypothetical protein